MRADFDARRDVFGPMLAIQLRAWAETTFRAAPVLRALGVFRPEELGVPPPARRFSGGGPRITRRGPRVSLLEREPPGYRRLRYFDVAAADYRPVVEPYTRPLREELARQLAPLLVPDARILDVGCGPGTGVLELAACVPEGEAIGCDLSRAMIEEAHRNALASPHRNVAFFQRDAQELPRGWNGIFDAVACTLSFHFFLGGDDAARSFHRVLAPRGRVFILDPGPAWFNAAAEPLVRLANPAFVRYRTGQEFCDLLSRTGFQNACWREVVPGIGLATALRSEDAPR